MFQKLRTGAALWLGLGVFVGSAFAHAPSFSRVSVEQNSSTGQISVAVQLTPPDLDSDGQISAAEYANAREFLHANSSQWLALKRGAQPLPLTAAEFQESFADKSLRWTAQVSTVSASTGANNAVALTAIEIPVISRLGEGHRAYVEVRRDGKLVADALLSRHESELILPNVTAAIHDSAPAAQQPLAHARGYGAAAAPNLSAPSAPVSGSNSVSVPSASSTAIVSSSRALGFFKLGIEHILTGYDHLLFLAGMILVCRKFRDFVGVITSFTLAHSATLGLSAIGGVQLSPAIVEPLIAASIVVVGIENVVLRGAEPKRRWMPAFAFGLIHGFGFAGALREAGFGSGLASWLSLGAFNVGVEAGQLALVVLALPLLAWLRKQPRIELPFVQFASAAVIACGAFWFAQRLGA